MGNIDWSWSISWLWVISNSIAGDCIVLKEALLWLMCLIVANDNSFYRTSFTCFVGGLACEGHIAGLSLTTINHHSSSLRIINHHSPSLIIINHHAPLNRSWWSSRQSVAIDLRFRVAEQAICRRSALSCLHNVVARKVPGFTALFAAEVETKGSTMIVVDNGW